MLATSKCGPQYPRNRTHFASRRTAASCTRTDLPRGQSRLRWTFVPSMVALVVFYFMSAPVMKTVAGVDPLSPQRIAERRAAVLDFISAALFLEKGAAK